MAKQWKTTKSDIVLPYNWALGPAWIRFFDGLKEGKILGTKCKKCGKVLVPARTFCPTCYEDMEEWVEVGQEGSVETWCLVNYKHYGQIKEPPYVIAQIHLDGADCGFNHFIRGFDLSDVDKVSDKVKLGMKVKAVWRKERHSDIYDIDYFAPVK